MFAPLDPALVAAHPLARAVGLSVGLLVLATVPIATPIALADDPPAEGSAAPPRTLTDAELAELAPQFAAGERDAMTALAAQGPAIVPRLRPLLETSAADRLRTLIERIARAAIDRSLVEEGAVRYRGQFDALRDLGPEGAEVMLQWFRDEDEPIDVRNRAATALGDIGSEAQVPPLRELADDFLAEAWVEREATFLLARFGDRARVERRLARLHEIADVEATTATLPAILNACSELAEVHYRIGEYEEAIELYQRKQALLEEMRDRVRPELRPALTEEVVVLQYNLACSLALAGRIAESFAALDRSLVSRNITLDMVRTDGDLRAVRADPKYAGWLAEWEQRLAEPDAGETDGSAAPAAPTEAPPAGPE